MMQPRVKKTQVFLYAAALAIWLAFPLAAPAQLAQVTVTPVGTPSFDVVDTHLFSGPTDAFPTLFPNHFPTRIVHGPSFDQEFSDGLALTGLPEKAVYSVAEFTAPSAVHLGYVLVPSANAPTGSTQDYASGPIIPNGNLPITISGDVFLNGSMYEQDAFNVTLPPIDGFDGRSHFLVEHWENSDFAPPGLNSLVGNYEYRLSMRDGNNNGYNIVSQFQVIPEPSSLCLVGLMAASLGTWFGRRPSSIAGRNL
jgi:hypothetical protein